MIVLRVAALRGTCLVPMDHAAQEDLNRATWSKRSAQQDLLHGHAFTDAGERAALDHALPAVAGKAILDLGVGMGRTIPILKPIAGEYRAIDFLPSMVEASRRAFPDAKIDVGDARSLADLPAEHFAMVTFSYNGIDAVSARDRALVFHAVRRVLAPGGVFFFSTLNIDGPSFRERPWKLRVWSPKSAAGYAWQALRQLAGAPLDLANWLKIRTAGERGENFAIAPLSAHHYGVLAHYTTLARQVEELVACGFHAEPVVFDNETGGRVGLGANTRNVDWFHIVATRT